MPMFAVTWSGHKVPPTSNSAARSMQPYLTGRRPMRLAAGQPRQLRGLVVSPPPALRLRAKVGQDGDRAVSAPGTKQSCLTYTDKNPRHVSASGAPDLTGGPRL